MQCYVCHKRPGTLHLTQIVGDQVQKLDLCPRCAKTRGVDKPTSYDLRELALGLEPVTPAAPIYMGEIDLSLLMNPLLNQKWLNKFNLFKMVQDISGSAGGRSEL